jgi:hypothetical protein
MGFATAECSLDFFQPLWWGDAVSGRRRYSARPVGSGALAKKLVRGSFSFFVLLLGLAHGSFLGERIARAAAAAFVFDEDAALDEIGDVAQRGVG